jgi:hypothetical protein
VDRCAQLAGPDPDPELCRVQPEPGDLCGDPNRLMSAEGKDPDAEPSCGAAAAKWVSVSRPAEPGSSFDHSEW